MNRLDFPDNPEAYTDKSWTAPNGLVFKYDGNGWTKQLLSGNVVLDLGNGNTVFPDRLLPDNMNDDEMLIYDEKEGWTGKNEIDGGTY